MNDAFCTSGNSPTLQPAFTIQEIHDRVSILQKQLSLSPSSLDEFQEDFGDLLQECDNCESYNAKDRTYGYVYYILEDSIDFNIYCNLCIANTTLGVTDGEE